MNRHASAIVLAILLLNSQPSFSQNTIGAKSRSATSGSGADSARIKQLEAAIAVLAKIESDPQFSPGPEIKSSLDKQIHDMTCEKNEILVKQSVSRSADLRSSAAEAYYDACIQAPPSGSAGLAGSSGTGMVNANSGKAIPPPTVKLPDDCPDLTSFKQTFSKDFNTQEKADNSPIPPTGKVTVVDRSKQVRLNSNSSGAEINTKSVVYLEFISRLRYRATLGGTVTPIAAPTIPDSIFPTSPAAAAQPKSPTAKPSSAPSAPSGPPPPPPVQSSFEQFNHCFSSIQQEVAAVQGSILSEEILLNNARGQVLNHLNNLQPVVGTLPEATSVDMSTLPIFVVPSFPLKDVVALKEIVSQFILQYAQFKDWAHQTTENGELYDSTVTDANQLVTALGQYLGGTNPTGTTSTPPPAPPATPPRAGAVSSAGTTSNSATATAGTGKTSTSPQTSSTNGSSCPVLTIGSKEVGDYESNRCFVNFWRQQFRTVAGEANAGDVDYFIADFKPACGGFFGQGTSTQMELTVVDSLNLTENPKQTNLDKIVCEPALSISSGLGLSFVPDKTPAFVPTIKTNSAGNPVTDSNGNPVIVQSLGYSSQADVRPGYALQVNTSLWSPRQMSFELHWSVGAMLTAASGGATTDIITGPTISLKKRSIFISPMYDLGLRTAYVPPFTVGTPQGNLTSPPTHQAWKSGFGLTITFPFNTSTNNTQSSNSSGKNGNAGSSATGGTPGSSSPN